MITKKAPRGRPFKKGQSGNPSGRPKKDKEVEELAAKLNRGAGDKHLTMARVAEIAQTSENEASALKACELLLAYEFGKPRQRTETQISGGFSVNKSARDMSMDELLEAIHNGDEG